MSKLIKLVCVLVLSFSVTWAYAGDFQGLLADEFNRAAYGDGYDIEKILSIPGGKLAAGNKLREMLRSATQNSFQE